MFKITIFMISIGAALYGFFVDLAAYQANQMHPWVFACLVFSRIVGTGYVLARVHGEWSTKDFKSSIKWGTYFLAGIFYNLYLVIGLQTVSNLLTPFLALHDPANIPQPY